MKKVLLACAFRARHPLLHLQPQRRRLAQHARNMTPLTKITCLLPTQVLYSSIRILGTKRSRLGLREFVQVGELYQEIAPDTNTATNRVEFSVAGFGTFRGELVIEASFNVATPSRAEVTFESAKLQPAQLEKMFGDRLPLLLEVFNPEGWLEVTYVDAAFRVGRDYRGNVFVLERECERS
jgi:PAP_fibrillin